MTFKIRETLHETWIVYDDNDGVIHGEFIDKWEADDLREFLELQDELWYEDEDSNDYLVDWEE